MIVRRSLFLFLCLLCACASTPSGPTRGGRGLEGERLPLLDAPARRLEVPGAVGGNAARVLLDVTRPLTLVAEGCLAGVSVAMSGERIQVPSASGTPTVYPAISLRELRVGGAPLGAMKVGLVQGEQACRVWLGLDVLGEVSLEIDPLRREVRVGPSRPAEAYPLIEALPGEETALIALSREPTTDVPLLPVRLSLDTVGFAGTFVLATAEEHSKLWLPPGAVEVTADLGAEAMISPGELELSAGMALTHAPLRVGSGSGAAVIGALGADTWGRFHAVLDVKAKALRLSRPRGSAGPCTGPGCLQAAVLERKTGAQGSVLVWGRLPQGAVATVQALDASGQALCELEVRFPPSGAGEGLAFPLAGKDAPGAGCAAGAARLTVRSLALSNAHAEQGVCVVGAGEAPRCRAGSALGRELPGSEGADDDLPEDELTEPEDPPPPPKRSRQKGK